MSNRFEPLRVVASIALALQLAGCAAVIRPVRDAISPPGEMNADGSINPCHGYRSNYEACGIAIYNGKRITKVAIGQTLVEVKTIMGKSPEERSIEAKDGRTVESWTFLTDYDRSVSTNVDFLDGRVSAIKQLVE